MVYQSNSNAYIDFFAQSALGTPAPAGSAASRLRVTGGSGIRVTKAATASGEIRADALSTRGRHGTQKVNVDYVSELSLGSHDAIIEALMRSTWNSGALVATSADFTTVTTGVNTIVAAGGSWVTKGFKVGQVIRGASFPDAANNGKNLRLVGVTATTLTTAETLVVNATPSGAPTITRVGKTLLNPTSGLVKRYFTLEEVETDLGQSTMVQDLVFGHLRLTMSPNGLLAVTTDGVGTGQVSALIGGASPYFTSSTAGTNVPMSVVDATIRVNGNDMVALSAFDIDMNIAPAAPDVFGSGAIKYAPDVFTGPLSIGINMTMLRKDLTLFSDFLAETQYSLTVLAVSGVEPKDFLSITIPNFTLGGVDPSALSRAAGGRTQSISIPPALVGVDNTGGAFDTTMIRFQTSAS